MTCYADFMEAILEVLERYYASVKLARGRCEGCGRILRDDQPRGQRACSIECADQAWLARQ